MLGQKIKLCKHIRYSNLEVLTQFQEMDKILCIDCIKSDNYRLCEYLTSYRQKNRDRKRCKNMIKDSMYCCHDCYRTSGLKDYEIVFNAKISKKVKRLTAIKIVDDASKMLYLEKQDNIRKLIDKHRIRKEKVYRIKRLGNQDWAFLYFL